MKIYFVNNHFENYYLTVCTCMYGALYGVCMVHVRCILTILYSGNCLLCKQSTFNNIPSNIQYIPVSPILQPDKSNFLKIVAHTFPSPCRCWDDTVLTATASAAAPGSPIFLFAPKYSDKGRGGDCSSRPLAMLWHEDGPIPHTFNLIIGGQLRLSEINRRNALFIFLISFNKWGNNQSN